VATADREFGPTGKVEAAEEQKVTPLELFFDLVFVLSFTQVTAAMAENPTWTGLGEGMLILAAVWWAWGGYAWLTNAIDPNEDVNRFAVFAAMAAMLIVSLATPGAFGDEALLFGCTYFVVRVLHLFLYIRAGRLEEGDELLGGVLGMAPAWFAGASLIIVASFFDGTAQAAVWIAALLIDYGGTLLAGIEGYRVHASHFAERFGLIIIIALGESIVAIGAGAGQGRSRRAR
jgi:low temperature requirement protein LtrA